MPDAAADLPRAPGAYSLLIRLDRLLVLDMPAFRGKTLAPGLFAYCGSAYGPGGIRARVSRHLRAGKPLRWHVDRLTAAGCVLQAGLSISGRECDLVAGIRSCGGIAALPGFGSSDCAACEAHLLRLPDGADLPAEIFDIVLPLGRKRR